MSSKHRKRPERPVMRTLTFDAGSQGPVSALLTQPPNPGALLVLAHGAGAGMRHPFLAAVADAFSAYRVATWRYQFPYMEAGRNRPDSPAIAQATVRAAVAAARARVPDVPIVAGGKSFGGRMTSQAAADETLPGVQGLVFFGFPLHAPGKPSVTRGEHLVNVGLPMLFLQGTRDAFADLEFLRPLCQRLGSRATLYLVEGGDHSFKVLKRSGRTQEHVMDELTDVAVQWIEAL
jgi:predicted alpha/beta-hydrolase family hydrolase